MGLELSTTLVSASRLSRARAVNVVVPLTNREISGPSPPTPVYASSITVCRLSCGIASKPVLVAPTAAR